MSDWLPLIALPPVWVLAVFAPGMLAVRRLKWGPIERLCTAVGVSLIVLYLAVFAIYLGGLGRWAYWALTAAFALAGAACWRDWAGLLRLHGVRRVLGVLALMLLWGTLCLSITRHYSGGGWARDWALHYQKVGVFLHGAADDPAVIREFVIDRAGFMNLVATYFAGLLGYRFDVFQVAFTWLNLLPVLPCCWLAVRFGRRRGARNLWVLAALLACLPIVWVNATYTWTKMPAAFFAMLGIGLYLRAIDKQDRTRMVVAAVMLGAGVLAHYVALPYALLVLTHYPLFVWWKRRRKWSELAWVVLGFALMLGTWFGWAVGRYGFEMVQEANNTLRHAGEETRAQFWLKVARSFAWNLVPPQIRPTYRAWAEQADTLGYLRDEFFVLYQMNLALITGTVTGVLAAVGVYRRVRFPVKWDAGTWTLAAVAATLVLVLWLLPGGGGASWLMRDLFPNLPALLFALAGAAWAGGTLRQVLRAPDRASTEVWFWRILIVGLPVLAALTLDVTGEHGAGHVYFHAWAMLAVAIVAVDVTRLRPWVKKLLGLGLAVDFLLGVALHFHVQHAIFSLTPDGLLETHGRAAQGALNWAVKAGSGWTFLGDRCAPLAIPLQILLLLAGLTAATGVAFGWFEPRKGDAP